MLILGMSGKFNGFDEPRAACVKTSSMNSWFRWNLVNARVLVEIISFSKARSISKGHRTNSQMTYLFLLPHLGACWASVAKVGIVWCHQL